MANKNPHQGRQKIIKQSKPPSVQDAALIVWEALRTAQEILKEEDPVMQLKACHAVFQGAQAYSKLYEVGEIEARLQALENSQAVPTGKDAQNDPKFN
jgi:hypothetical protein